MIRALREVHVKAYGFIMLPPVAGALDQIRKVLDAVRAVKNHCPETEQPLLPVLMATPLKISVLSWSKLLTLFCP